MASPVVDTVQVGDDNILQKHASFFDRNKDGLIYPWETFRGFRAIGCGMLLSTASAFLINIALSQKTRPGKFPSLLFPIEVKNLQRAKHGCASGVYDAQGRFVPSKFEEMFSKYAQKNSDSLTLDELKAMLKANRVPKGGYAGRVGALVERKILYFLCKDNNGLLSIHNARAFYDGSLFEKREKYRLLEKIARLDTYIDDYTVIVYRL